MGRAVTPTETTSYRLVRPHATAVGPPALDASQQAVVDSEFLWHGGQHSGDHLRYAVIVSCESGPALEQWIASQRTGAAQPEAAASS